MRVNCIFPGKSYRCMCHLVESTFRLKLCPMHHIHSSRTSIGCQIFTCSHCLARLPQSVYLCDQGDCQGMAQWYGSSTGEYQMYGNPLVKHAGFHWIGNSRYLSLAQLGIIVPWEVKKDLLFDDMRGYILRLVVVPVWSFGAFVPLVPKKCRRILPLFLIAHYGNPYWPTGV